MTIPKEILKKVKLLEVKTRKLVNSTFAGQYHSAFKGQGMTFSDFREYVPGDDVRSISWALTARTGKTYIKKFEEERDLTIILAVDVSGSTDFGSSEVCKGEAMTHLAALLGFGAAKNNDNVGLLLFSDQVEHYVPPKKGRGHIQRLLRDLYYFKPKSHGTKVSSAVDFLRGVLKKKSTVFFVSDFGDETFGIPLRTLSKKHETIALVVRDKLEEELPALGLIDVYDPESGEVLTVDTNSPLFRREYKKKMDELKWTREREFRRAQIDRIDIEISQDYFDPVIAYFKRKVS